MVAKETLLAFESMINFILFLLMVDLIFRQESYFAYLFGVREPGFYGAIVSSLD